MYRFSNSLLRYIRIFFIQLLLIYFPNSVSAFFDDFTLDPRTNPNWDVENPSGLTFDNPGVTLTSNSGTFPYLKTSPSNSLGENQYHEITFQYLDSNSDWGVGASFTDNPPVFPTYLGTIEDYLNYNIIYFFGNKLHSVSTICPLNLLVCPNSWWFIYPNSPPSNGYLTSTDRDFNIHTISVVRTEITTGNYSYKAYLDNVLMVETERTDRIIDAIWIGHPSDLGAPRIWPKLRVISVLSTPNRPAVFPYLSQKDPRWASDEYDSASQWAGLEKSGIDRWGCALTSVAMTLQNYGVKSAMGLVVNPNNLNSWLKSQPDGYIGPGLLNWIAVTRYVKESYEAGMAPKKLEYVRSYLPTSPTLPAILSTGSHFVVAHGEDATNWNINDPASLTTKTLAKNTSIKSINRFVESETDLSYMLFAISTTDSAVLKDESNNQIDINWIDESLSDDLEFSTASAIKIGMVAKPTTGKYLLTITKAGVDKSEAKVYLYDQLAMPITDTFELNEDITTVQINYSKENSVVDTILEVDLTPPPVPNTLLPLNGTYARSAAMILDWSDVEDISMPVTYFYRSYWDGGSYGPVSTGSVSQIDASGTADGEYRWQVQACDSVGNCSEWSSEIMITVDNISPSADIVFPSPAPTSNYFEVVYSELINPAEATEGAKYFLSNWPGAGGSGDLLNDATITYNQDSKTARILFSDPSWYISPEQLWGVQDIHDLAGNTLTTSPYTEYSTPITAPIVTAPISTPNPSNLTTQTWSWLAGSDIGSGVKGYSTRTFDVIADEYLNDWLWMGQVLGTSTSLGEGKWQLALQATDNSGNTSETKTSETLTIDTTRASIPTNLHFINPDVSCGGFTNSKNITFDWDDATDNNKVAGYEYNVDYPLGINRGTWTTFFTTSSYRGALNEGVHYLKLRTKDSAGNYSDWSNSCTITYDYEYPTHIESSIFSGWYRQPQTSYFGFTDANLAGDYAAPNCEIATEGTAQTCSLKASVCDKAGNCTSPVLRSNPLNLDLTEPTVQIDQWGKRLTGRAADNLSGIDKVELAITKPGEAEHLYVANGTTTWHHTMDPSPVGAYKVVIKAYDMAGNISLAVTKDFDINPSDPPQGGSVQGVSTNASGPVQSLPSIRLEVASSRQSDEEPVVPMTTEALTELVPEQGEVLGENTMPSQHSYKYLWIALACATGLLGLLFFIFQAKK